ncbi:MAG: hypothetical protein ACRDCN_03645 [Tannerellaceae bacterium]
MRIKSSIIIALLVTAALGVVKLQHDTIKSLKSDLKETTYNFEQVTSDNFSIVLKNTSLEKYIKDLDSGFKRKIDSVTTEHEIKVKDLKKVSIITNTTIVKDTVYVPVETSKDTVTNLYHSDFSAVQECFKISGRIVSLDQAPQIYFTELGYKNESCNMVYRESKPWWRFFKKRKIMVKTVSGCGVTTVKEISEER